MMKVDCGHADLQVWVNERLVVLHIQRGLGTPDRPWTWWLAYDVRDTASDYDTEGESRTWAEAYKRGMRAVERTRRTRK